MVALLSLFVVWMGIGVVVFFLTVLWCWGTAPVEGATEGSAPTPQEVLLVLVAWPVAIPFCFRALKNHRNPLEQFHLEAEEAKRKHEADKLWAEAALRGEVPALTKWRRFGGSPLTRVDLYIHLDDKDLIHRITHVIVPAEGAFQIARVMFVTSKLLGLTPLSSASSQKEAKEKCDEDKAWWELQVPGREPELQKLWDSLPGEKVTVDIPEA